MVQWASARGCQAGPTMVPDHVCVAEAPLGEGAHNFPV